jgi:hypothetical protein
LSEAQSDPASRGADNVVRECLSLAANETLAILHYRAAPLAALLAAAAARVGARVVSVACDDRAGSPVEEERFVSETVGDAAVSVLVAAHGLPPPLSMAMLEVARRKRTRHLHLTRADVRLFAQSYRAEPARIAELNERLRVAMKGAVELRARSEAGTDVRVRLDRALPTLAADGRPTPGRADNLPSGYVYFHPAAVDGVVVPDRGLVGAIRISRERLRGASLRMTLAAGRVRSVSADDPEIQSEIEGYLASHVNAPRVGLVVVPTNYLVRTESGMEVQDALLPGLVIGLGYTDAAQTQAPFSCPVQLRLLSRRPDVAIDARPIVRGGRFEEDLVTGIDPFR